MSSEESIRDESYDTTVICDLTESHRERRNNTFAAGAFNLHFPSAV